jgi:Fe-S-cluster containining protein
MAECKRCGCCCLSIPISHTRAELYSLAKTGNPDALFLLSNWKPISLKEAQRLNPEYRKHETTKSIFTCRKLNRRTKKCRVQAHKPRICSGYPYYDRLRNFLPVTSRCGYPTINPDMLTWETPADEGRQKLKESA